MNLARVPDARVQHFGRRIIYRQLQLYNMLVRLL